MTLFDFSKNPSFTLLGFFSFLVLVFSQIYAGKGLLDKPRELLSPPVGLQHFTFGHNDLTADILWIRTIQDFDYCDHPISENQCKGNSWLYRMLDAVTELSPKFRMPYAMGAVALSVLVSDIEGAAKIFDRGTQEYPNDWPSTLR